MRNLDELAPSRYALLRTYRRDGTAVDTPVWFAVEHSALVFRTKIGPKTARLIRDPRVQLRVCDYQGRVQGDTPTFDGRAAILDSVEAQKANDTLRQRYGWQYNIVPLLRIPGVHNIHSGLPLREKLRRARDRGVWHDSVIVRVVF